jgi:hypothetical protein
MRELVLASAIDGVFIVQKTEDNKFDSKGNLVLGTPQNYQDSIDGVITWHHFYLNVDAAHTNTERDSIASINAKLTSSRQVFERSLREITDDSIAIVLELMADNETHRLDQFIPSVQAFKRYKDEYMNTPIEFRELYTWLKFSEAGGSLSRMRNTAVGSLLVDLSEGVGVESAKASFIAKMRDYMIPQTEASEMQMKKAQKAFDALGLTPALSRRHAQIGDISVNDVLWKDGDTKLKGDVSPFAAIMKPAKVNVHKMGNVTEVPIAKFMSDILPTLSSLDVMMEEQHENHLVNLTAALHDDAPHIFRWNNDKAWVYRGNAADSIKQRVRDAGGLVDCVLRISLSWHNHDDLDLYVREPNGNTIYYGNKQQMHPSSGMLDVDANLGGGHTRKPVENTRYTDKHRMPEGKYQVSVKNHALREYTDLGFTIEIEFAGVLYHFNVPKIAQSSIINVVTFEYTKAHGVRIIECAYPQNKQTNEAGKVWGLTCDTFHKVKVVCNSPNYWNENNVGHKHIMFLIDECVNPDSCRGFFNEQLQEELKEHRKTMEMMGKKMLIESVPQQLAGLGFNTTERNSLHVRATTTAGHPATPIEKMYKILF